LPAILACTVSSAIICASKKNDALYLFSRQPSGQGVKVRINTVQTISLRTANRPLGGWRRLKAKLRGWFEAVNFNAESRAIHLSGNEVIRLTRMLGFQQVEVRHGTIWLTGTPAKGDVLLRSGERFHLTRDWPFVLQAVKEAQIILR
jgi:Protein of unknown function (DUF2917)